jgi:hypothetical protein
LRRGLTGIEEEEVEENVVGDNEDPKTEEDPSDPCA